jgi:hypothetical protein
LPRRARYSSVIALRQLGSLSGGNRRVPVDRSMHVRPLTGNDMYARGGAHAMHGRGRMRRQKGGREGASEGGGECAGEGGAVGAGEGGTVGVCGVTEGTTIEGASSRNS